MRCMDAGWPSLAIESTAERLRAGVSPLQPRQPGQSAALRAVEIDAGDLRDPVYPVAQGVAVHGQRGGRGAALEAVLHQQIQRPRQLVRERTVDARLDLARDPRRAPQQHLRDEILGADLTSVAAP